MKFIDLTGKRYGNLVVVKRAGTYVSPGGSKSVTWLCRCDCGNETVVQATSIKSGVIKSCGCKKFLHPFNETEEKGDVVCIKVGDREVLVDKDDMKLIYPNRVHIGKNGYAYVGKHTALHKIIHPCEKGYFVDHINQNRLDNRKENLRIVTPSESNMNRKPMSNTGEYGISLRKDGFYMVYVDRKYCGIRKTLDEALSLRNESIKGTKQAELKFCLQ